MPRFDYPGRHSGESEPCFHMLDHQEDLSLKHSLTLRGCVWNSNTTMSIAIGTVIFQK